MLESAYKKVKESLQTVAGTTYTEDDIINLVKDEVGKFAPNVPVDTIVKLIQQELGKLSVSVNVASVEANETSSTTQVVQQV